VAEHPDLERFRRALEVRRTDGRDQPDVSVLDDLFVENVVWHDAASGKERVIDRWQAWAHEGTKAKVGGVYADGLHTIATVELSGASGNTVEQALIFHLDSGKVTEFWSLPTEAAVAAALVSGEVVPTHPFMEVFEAAEATRERNTFEPEDIANIDAFLREDVEWHGARDIPGVKGRDALIALAKQFKEATGGSLHLDMGSMFIDETHAASIVHLTATRPDKPGRKLDVMEVNLFHLDEHGKAFELWGVSADQDAIDAFWLP
jgi:SnoaL-like domain